MKRFHMDGTDVFYLVCAILVVIGCIDAGEFGILGQLAVFGAISAAVYLIFHLVRKHRKGGQTDKQS